MGAVRKLKQPDFTRGSTPVTGRNHTGDGFTDQILINIHCNALHFFMSRKLF
jgi:hypothetical protein